MERISNGYSLCSGRFERWVRNRVSVGITSAFGVPGENNTGKRVVEFCAER